MFAHISKSAKALIATLAASAVLMVGCEETTESSEAAPAADRGVVASAPKHNPTYEDGDRPEERTSDASAITTNECPSYEEVYEFVDRHVPEIDVSTDFFDPMYPLAMAHSWKMSSSSIEDEGYVVHQEIDHRTFETIIGTINSKCLPTLDGSVNYKPGAGNEKLRDQWFNFQSVWIHADELNQEYGSPYVSEPGLEDSIEVWMDEASWEFTPQAKTMASYATSLQLLGVISALSGGPFFYAYGNNIPHLTNPEMYGMDRDRTWSTAMPAFGNPLGFYMLDGEAEIQRLNEQFMREFEAENGITYEEHMKQLEAEIDQLLEEFESEFGM